MNDKINLAIWRQVESTDPSATKQYKGVGGFSGTAVNATYLNRRATEIFGPMGIGWGAEIVSEYITEGAPMSHTVDGNPPILCNEKIHTLRLKLWYMLDGKRGEVEQFGHTDLVFKNKWGFQTEHEPSKKSYTDALKKCLSMLGFAADIFLGEFDDAEYREQLQTEFDIQKAEDREEMVDTKKTELIDYVSRHRDSISRAVSMSELNGIAKTALRHLERQGSIKELSRIAKNATVAINSEYENKKAELAPKREMEENETV